MKQKNKFDLVMDYIDSNIHKELDVIKRDIYSLIGFNSNSFGHCFTILTNDTLFHYITTRRMYFAGKELYENPDKSICEIALDYGYSEQSAFTRAMKALYGCTPYEIRKGSKSIPNQKYYLDEIYNSNTDTRSERIFKALRNNEEISSFNIYWLEEVSQIINEYKFDVDTAYQIADLADKLEISPMCLADKCIDLIVERREYELSLRDEVAIDLGINSTKELDEICNYYCCKYYDLDQFMVQSYRKNIKLSEIGSCNDE